MGSNMVRRLLKDSHRCIVFDTHPDARKAMAAEGAVPAESLKEMVAAMKAPRAVWLMIPAAIVDRVIHELRGLLAAGDIIIDGGNSFYQDDIRRAAELKPVGIGYLDVGVSGGVWGLQRGYCQMIGGDAQHFQHLEPIFKSLAPGVAGAPRTAARENGPLSAAECGYLHCGPAGAGHFVKMVHNGIEYGIMAAYAEGLNILKRADVGLNPADADSETAPLAHPEHYQYRLDIPAITEVWRRGTVIQSWLLDLTAEALAKNGTLDNFSGRVSDSGEGRWTLQAAIDEGVSAPTLAAALFDRFASRGASQFADRVMSAMRYEFGGHEEKPH
jgi:6-phosphogluconate dehydrogenase